MNSVIVTNYARDYSRKVLYECIKVLLEVFSSLEQNWAFTGSVGQYIQGMELSPHDIDIQTNKQGAYSINKLLSKYCIEQVYFKESEKIRSYFGVFKTDSVKIEVMGDIQKLVNDSWTPKTDLKSEIVMIDWKGMKIPVMDLGYELHAYHDMGRFERAELIKKFLQNKKTIIKF